MKIKKSKKYIIRVSCSLILVAFSLFFAISNLKRNIFDADAASPIYYSANVGGQIYGNKKYQNSAGNWVNLTTHYLEVDGNKALCASPEKILPEPIVETNYYRGLDTNYVKRVLYLYTKNISPSSVSPYVSNLDGYSLTNIYHSLFLNFGDGNPNDANDPDILNLIWDGDAKTQLITLHNIIKNPSYYDDTIYDGIDDYTLHIATSETGDFNYQLIAWLEYSTPICENSTLNIKKQSSNALIISGRSEWNNLSASFNVCNGGVCSTVTTNSNGDYSGAFAAGTYTITETTAPNNFYPDSTPQTITLGCGETKTATSYSTPIAATAVIHKVSAKPDITNNNPNYTTAGAIYNICSDSNCNNVLASLTTDSNGLASYVVVPGTYYTKEVQAPNGFQLDNSVKSFYISAGESKTIDVANEPKTGGVKIAKVDAETMSSTPQGNAKLSGAIFTIYSKLDNSVYKVITADSNGIAATGASDLLIGEYYIKETTAPTGYKISNKRIDFSITENGIKYLTNDAFANEIIRGDIKFLKIDKDTNEPLSGVAFKITQVETGESHVVVTDDNGRIDTSSEHILHSQNTNANDSVLESTDVIDNELLDVEAGIWFGINTEVNDEYRALPYGTYIIEELQTSANIDYDLIEPITFIIDENLDEKNEIIDLGAISNKMNKTVPDTGINTKENSHNLNNNILSKTVIATIAIAISTIATKFIFRKKHSISFTKR